MVSTREYSLQPEAFWETYTSVKPGCTIMGENDPVRL
jgi:hypothetical protein